MTDLKEYLYVDQVRLDAYFEQISDPIAYDKVPVWKAGLTLTGPAAENQQARFARPFTRVEKIRRLLRFLQTNQQASRESLLTHDTTDRAIEEHCAGHNDLL